MNTRMSVPINVIQGEKCRPDKLSVRCQSLPLKGEFRIARGAKTTAEVIIATAYKDGFSGYGEAVPYARYGESPDTCMQSIRDLMQNPPTRSELQHRLPPGAARNALDCALWDLEIRTANSNAEAYCEQNIAASIPCAYTLSIDSPAATAATALRHKDKPLLKLKLGDHEDQQRVLATRQARPDAEIIVDANEAWSPDTYQNMLECLTRANITLIEQPFAAPCEQALRSLPRPIPICADESCHSITDLPRLRELYQAVNIKLDKSGGLTHALSLKAAAIKAGFKIMLGCMVASSLAITPALLLCQDAQWVDLDAPLWLAQDRTPGLTFDKGCIIKKSPTAWGNL